MTRILIVITASVQNREALDSLRHEVIRPGILATKSIPSQIRTLGTILRHINLDKSGGVLADFRVGLIELPVGHSCPSGIWAEALRIFDAIVPEVFGARVAEDVGEIETGGCIEGIGSVPHGERNVLGAMILPVGESECQICIAASSVRGKDFKVLLRRRSYISWACTWVAKNRARRVERPQKEYMVGLESEFDSLDR